MNTIIIYESTHHGNTKKLVDAICEKFSVLAVSIEDATNVDFSQYNTIGIASGIAFGKFYKAMETFATEKIPLGKNIFLLYTCRGESGKYTNHIVETLKAKGCNILGSYGCLGFDTFGPFKFVGVKAIGHQREDEITGAVRFYEGLSL